MSMSRPGAVPRVPTPPRGEQVASYATYLEAQKAVDFLSDNKFAVELVTIVGTDLKMVERVTGRLTYGRVAIAGAASGAWFGLFVGLLLFLFSGDGSFVLTAIGVGAGFGLLFSVLSYALTRGRRDFTSQSQIVASAYGILCAPERAGDARQLLSRMPEGAGGVRAAAPPANPTWGTPGAPTPPVAPPAPAPEPPSGAPVPPVTPPARTPDPRWTTPTGEPRYGAMRPTSDQPTDPQPGAQSDPPSTPGAQPDPPSAPGSQQPDQPERPA
ncbi:general stress protein [Cellulosimicrobium protaetiae]|uniref:general stress protein n=1 Tax=Cellulosimicrobium protaetiae TaxID=2587808 RepID=UPI001C100D37|nr:general stress protein [Cellulosimicrobium protaetiae]